MSARAPRTGSCPRARACLALVALVATVATPATARADDLSVLIFPVVIWPMAALLALVLLIDSVVCVVALGRRVTGPRAAKLGAVSVILAVVSWVIFAIWTVAWVGVHAGQLFEFALHNIGAFVVVILPSLILGFVVRRRGRDGAAATP